MDNVQKRKSVADTIRAYPLQLKESWEEVSRMYLPDEYKEVKNVVLCGMGGSALGGRIAKSVLLPRLRIPLEIYNQYTIPAYCGTETLVICSSYSGSTEETLESTYEAIKRGCKVFGITTGGKLKEIFEENKLPFYLIDEKHNPSKQPRMGIGYAAGSVLGLLQNIGVANVLEEEIDEAVKDMNTSATEFQENIPEHRNIAKRLTEKLKNKGLIIVASEHMVGASHTIKNQFNENAKTFSDLHEISELNHHLMEGLKYPVRLKENLKFFFVNSELYSDRIKKRYEVTKKVIEKNGYDFVEYVPNSNKHLSQAFEIIILASFITYYLTDFYKIDPLAIPWVDFFKEEMK